MQLARQFTTVTPFSRWLALSLFIILPFATFFLGLKYGRNSQTIIEPQTYPVVPVVNTTYPTPTANIPVGQRLYTSEKLGFTITVPNETVISEPDENNVTFMLKGANQKEQTEFYDGIGLGFTKVTFQSDKETFKEYAEKEMAKSTINGEIVQPLEERSYDGHTGYTYRARGLGYITYTYIQIGSNTVLKITDTSAGGGVLDYPKQASQIIATLRITAN